MSGELALGSINVDGQGQHQTSGLIHGGLRHGAQLQPPGATKAIGADPFELPFLSHAVGIGRLAAGLKCSRRGHSAAVMNRAACRVAEAATARSMAKARAASMAMPAVGRTRCRASVTSDSRSGGRPAAT